LFNSNIRFIQGERRHTKLFYINFNVRFIRWGREVAYKVVLNLTLDLFGGREVAHTVVLILTLDLFGGREVEHTVVLILTLDLLGGGEVAHTFVLILTLDLFRGRGGTQSCSHIRFK
jgi:hypothetical protein